MNVLLIPIVTILGFIYLGSKAMVAIHERRFNKMKTDRIKSQKENVLEVDFCNNGTSNRFRKMS